MQYDACIVRSSGKGLVWELRLLLFVQCKSSSDNKAVTGLVVMPSTQSETIRSSLTTIKELGLFGF